MSDYKLTKKIKEIELLRQSFNYLAENTFDINFEKWYQDGYWGDNYIPYCLVENNRVVSNASVTLSEMVVDEKVCKTAQIGTVMTDERYRGKGLSKRLIEAIISDFEEQVDFIYLFANETVLEFYPKFGFKRVNELSVEIDMHQRQSKQIALETVTFKEHQEKIEEFARKRNNSHVITYLVESSSLTLFYYGTVFSEGIHYIKELDCYICFEIEDEELHLFDCLSIEPIDLEELVSYLPLKDIKKVSCHFLPSEKKLLKRIEKIPLDEDALFVLGIEPEKLAYFKLPLFNHA